MEDVVKRDSVVSVLNIGSGIAGLLSTFDTAGSFYFVEFECVKLLKQLIFLVFHKSLI